MMLIRALILTGPLLFAAWLPGCRSEPRSRAWEAGKSAPAPVDAARGASVRRALDVRVDASSAAGDGARRRVYATLASALAAHPGEALSVTLAGGTHRGPFTLADGSRLEGVGPTVILGPATGAALVAQGALSLRGLALRGGTQAVQTRGHLRLERVDLVGQTAGCLRLDDGAELDAREVRFSTEVPSATCLELAGSSRATIRDSSLEGPWGRAIGLTEQASLSAERVRIRGSEVGVRQRGGRVVLTEVSIEAGTGPGGRANDADGVGPGGGGGPAVFVAHGALELRGLRTRGHEYGLLTGSNAVVRGRSVRSVGARRAGLGLVGSDVVLRDVRVEGVLQGGSFGGIQSVNATTELDDVQVRDVHGVGLSQRSGSLTLSRATIRGVRAAPDGSEGEGLSLRAGRAMLSDVTISRTGGVGMVVGESAEVLGRQLSVQGAASCGVAVETLGRLDLEDLSVRGSRGPGLLAEGDVRIRISALVSEENRDGPVLADCDGGAQLRLGTITGQAPMPQDCIERSRPVQRAGPDAADHPSP